MPRLHCIIFLPFLLLSRAIGDTGTLEKGSQVDLLDFFNRCPPQRCGDSGPEIRYPFRLESSPPSCGATDLFLSCSGNLTLLPLPTLPPSLSLSVASINYTIGLLVAKLDGPSSDRCPLKNLRLLNFSSSRYSLSFSYVNCSQRIPHTGGSSDEQQIAGPISCLGGGGSFVYAVDAEEYMDILPPYCVVISNQGHISYDYSSQNWGLASAIDAFVEKREIFFQGWKVDIPDQCAYCEFGGGTCGFSKARSQSFCYKAEHHHRSNLKLIIGTLIGGASVIVLVSILAFYIYRKSDNEEEMRVKIEGFLASYKDTNPMRYTYSDIKKITKRFKQKLGQGGFGSVYKGELLNGIPIAVKMIETSRGEGEEFINEVATIGRIHHVNVVRLLGFCSEGTRLALVYEFMPNESLEKFIFSKESKSVHQQFSMDKLQEIAVGIAQGIEYLHQGCDQRILHFDIKPHNILLDHNFIPKISDFGLSKLCSRDQSLITMTAARGTMGYIAPEIYSRNFGNVSYKSDIYSFGMLLLEMVSGRRNVDPSVEDQSAVYFPEWIYEQLVKGENLDLVVKRKGNEEEIAKKLVLVALWCIQWSPMDRPTMTRVVQMLMGELQGLEIPPKPFVSSPGLINMVSINVV